jgi:ABC-type polysaccharide/polyol phosphate export permease
MFMEKLPGFDYGNPLAGIIINARRVMMEGIPPDFKLLGYDLGYAIIILFFGLLLLNKLGAKAAEKL